MPFSPVADAFFGTLYGDNGVVLLELLPRISSPLLYGCRQPRYVFVLDIVLFGRGSPFDSHGFRTEIDKSEY